MRERTAGRLARAAGVGVKDRISPLYYKKPPILYRMLSWDEVGDPGAWNDYLSARGYNVKRDSNHESS